MCSLVLNHPDTICSWEQSWDLNLQTWIPEHNTILTSLFLVPLFQVHVSISIFTQTSSLWLSVIPLPLLLQYFSSWHLHLEIALFQPSSLRSRAHWNPPSSCPFAVCSTHKNTIIWRSKFCLCQFLKFQAVKAERISGISRSSSFLLLISIIMLDFPDEIFLHTFPAEDTKAIQNKSSDTTCQRRTYSLEQRGLELAKSPIQISIFFFYCRAMTHMV